MILTKLAIIYFLIGFKHAVLPYSEPIMPVLMKEAADKTGSIGLAVFTALISSVIIFFFWPVFIIRINPK